MSSEYYDKTYLVTGASSGIGLCVCKALAARGANVIMIARNGDKLSSAYDSIPAGKHMAIPFDVSQTEKIAGIVNDVYEKYQKIAGMVYCVGNGDICRLRDLNYERLHAVMLSNFYGFLEFVRSLSRAKKKNDQMSIVAISSLASNSPEKYFTAYSASKAAMESAVKCLALELISRNIIINSIKPGVARTERLDHLNDITGDIESKIKENGFQPLGLIPPEDVAEMAIYLLGNNSKYITGAALPINGGAPC